VADKIAHAVIPLFTTQGRTGNLKICPESSTSPDRKSSALPDYYSGRLRKVIYGKDQIKDQDLPDQAFG
jgi:hypothetical protein